MSLFDLIINIIEVITYIWFITKSLTKNDKYTLKSSVIFFAIILAFVNYSGLLGFYNAFYTSICILMCVFYSVRYFKNGIIEKVTIGLSAVLLSLVAALITFYMADILLGINIIDNMDFNFNYVIVMLFGRLIHYVIAIIIVFVKKNNTSISIDYKWFWLVIVLVATIISAVICYDLFVKNKVEMIFIVLIIFDLIVFISVFIGVFTIIKSEKNKIDNLLELTELKYQTSIIKQSEINFNEIKTLKHDLKHEIAVIKGYLESNDLNGALSSLNKYNSEIEIVSSGVYTENYVVDYLISSKFKTSKNQDISVKSSIEIFEIYLNLEDLCLIIGNLFDNSIENCSGSKIIEFEFKKIERFIFISISNSIDKSYMKDNPELHSTKSNDGQHGFGLKSVKRKINKIGGELIIRENLNMFIVELFILNDLQ